MIFTLSNGSEIDVDQLLQIARDAGAGILKVYNDDPENSSVTYKDDQSPLTLADSTSHQIIAANLEKLTPNIPLLSEEGKNIPYEERKNWKFYWCVDPLDGTKEFIKRNGEFTVNIALISNNKPVLGIIYVPVTGVMYYGGQEIGCWKIAPNKMPVQLNVTAQTEEWISVGSRTHSSDEEAELLAKYNIANTIAAGSSLKFCMIAEGSAHIYYRHGPTMEWDTAAGQAIAQSAGAVMTTPTGEPFQYNKPSLLNGSFLCKIR